ncbi:transient receptor potential cation channel protein painless-like [Periplaneta americana]|uniref:transient receptor potential cation channel protein painless-like n=1 Tax=Periplaneta americana TaxID=6978 RepID=UPI0037E95B22
MNRLKTFQSVFYKVTEDEPSKQLLDLCKDRQDEDTVFRLRELRRRGADPNVQDGGSGKARAPIHYAAKRGSVEVLSFLLLWDETDKRDHARHEVALGLEATPRRLDVNLVDAKGRTALHYAAKTICPRADSARFLRCLSLLLNSSAALNVPDRAGYTPVTYAVLRRHKDRLLAMLNHARGGALNLDISPADGEVTARAAIRTFYPELSHSLPPAPDHVDGGGGDTEARLLDALRGDRLAEFRSLLEDEPQNPDYGDPYHASLVELACAMRGRLDFVRALLGAGVSPNTRNSIHRKPLLHLAVQEGRADVLELLLDHPNTRVLVTDSHGRNALHYVARQRGEPSVITSCVVRLLGHHLRFPDKPRFDVDAQDYDGNTALHLAGRYGHEQTVLTLLRNDASLLVRNGRGEYALTSVDADTLRAFLDEQVDCANTAFEDKGFYIELHYAFLGGAGMTALLLMAQRPHLWELLKHPVLTSFLSLRWKRVRTYFSLNVLLYTLFVVLLTTQVLVTDYGALRVPLICLVVLLSLREFLQFVLHPFTYLKSAENYLELAVFAGAVVLVCSDAITPAVRRHVAPILILAAWAELVLLTGRLPILSVQLEMSKKVALTFAQYMPWYAIVIGAFALSFYCLFRDVEGTGEENLFLYPFAGIFKTVLMMTGEYNLAPTIFDVVPVTSHLIFMLFVFLVAIVMLNLLSGLAVGDTSLIRDKADVLSLVYRVKLVVFMEQSLHVFTSCFGSKPKFPEQIWVYPNRHRMAYTDLKTSFSVDKAVLRDTLGIVSRKKKINIKKWNRATKSSKMKSEDDVAKMLDSYEKRLKAIEDAIRTMEDMIQQLVRSSSCVEDAAPR